MLGLCIAYDKNHMDPVKVQGCLPTGQFPIMSRMLDHFWGSPISIVVFIRNFSEVAKHWNALLQKDAKWE